MTDDLSQCGNCIYHYTYKGRDMCKQVGDDFYLQWKVENCPYHTSITKVAAISDEIYRLKSENAALRERLKKAVELPSGDRVWYIAEDEEGQESYIIPKPTSSLTVEELKYEMDKKYFTTREAAEKRLAELNGGKQ